MVGVPEDQWWYCLRHSRVEQGPGCPNQARMGPYPDRDTAERALTIAAERNSAWEEENEEER
ncbi:hypothetical protein [Nocardiopsis algeriensis]|uniref:SPOR domain-containing protein n=1 Tax=Nocardiopsis algeriensis TaxID=1478215 RepID=A0A841IKF6_9ACTN|nr:hypothetical protein [Nocardiopsis algeriensis]MBB6119259.1 hypothetical protein [Nocardiopsis algeriensis]